MGIMRHNILVGIDPGSEESGIVLFRELRLIEALIVPNAFVWDKVTQFSDNGNLLVVVEDIRPFSSKLTMQTIETCKFIGEVRYRAAMAPGAKIDYVSRFEVKKWVFDVFPEIAVPTIEHKILVRHTRNVKKGRKGMMNKDGSMRKASFINVNDQIVRQAMAKYWNISDFGKGKKQKEGLKSHAWQALGALSCYLATRLGVQP